MFQRIRTAAAIILFVIPTTLLSQGRTVETLDNVKAKKYPKSKRIEFALPAGGLFLTTPLVNTYVIQGGITYFSDEEDGWGIEGMIALTEDKSERECLETFYNDIEGNISAECGSQDSENSLASANSPKSNYGPAYVPIREMKMMFALNYVWNPIYGKQLFWMSGTNHFDVFFTLGGGIAMSDYYAEQTTLKNGQPSRATQQSDTGEVSGGASADETYAYGEAGRPEPEAQTNPYINLGFGQRFHFAKWVAFRIELRDFILLGTPGGFENHIAVIGGFSFRL